MNYNGAIKQLYKVECFDKDGNLKWKDGFENLVVTTGRNQYLDATLKTGVTSPTWFIGLKDAVAAIAADTMGSHAGWAELTPYSQGTRPAFVLGTIAAGSVDNSASKAVFTINGTATIGGAFVANNSTKAGSTGILLGAGEFAAARSVLSGDTLNVTVTCSITSS
jgi:predicted hotdog family 3-hydroxylacyl-ACP dehydratase